VDNGAEKTFFLRNTVNLLFPFVDPLFSYQEILEPKIFAEKLKKRNLTLAEYQPNKIDQDILLYLFKHADSNSDWVNIESLFSQLTFQSNALINGIPWN